MSAVWWISTVGLVVALLVLDFFVAARRPHHVGVREAATWSGVYIGVALAFGAVVWALQGGTAGGEYLTGWLVEKSLSVDNLFVFVIIMSRFAVPDALQQRVLLFGIAAALVMRALFIAVGAAAISAFSWVFVIFGVFLIYTAVQLARHRSEAPEGDNAVLRHVQKVVPTTPEFDGTRLRTRVDGRRVFTPLFVVFIAIATTDLLFALDSIPAVFGITSDAFLVFAANAFALLGLRALYFLIAGLLDRLVYLSLGLSVVLAFIGVKLILTFLHEDVDEAIPHVPTGLSLAIIVGVLAITTVASLVRVRRSPELAGHRSGSASEVPREAAPPQRPGHLASVVDDPDAAGTSPSGRG